MIDERVRHVRRRCDSVWRLARLGVLGLQVKVKKGKLRPMRGRSECDGSAALFGDWLGSASWALKLEVQQAEKRKEKCTKREKVSHQGGTLLKVSRMRLYIYISVAT